MRWSWRAGSATRLDCQRRLHAEAEPDVERYAKEPDTVLYDTIRQGAFSCYFDREAYSLYLVKKVYSGAAEGELIMLAQLVTEEAV